MPADREELELFATKLAKESISFFIVYSKPMPPPPTEEIPEEFRNPAGVFVTLKKDGQLRGCIGTIAPRTPTAAEEIIRNAVGAALGDPRFPRVILEEMPFITFSVDVLGEPEEVDSIKRLNPKTYGVIVSARGRSGVLLPDIEGIENARHQFEIAMQKAGFPSSQKVKIERFKVTRYGKK